MCRDGTQVRMHVYETFFSYNCYYLFEKSVLKNGLLLGCIFLCFLFCLAFMCAGFCFEMKSVRLFFVG